MNSVETAAVYSGLFRKFLKIRHLERDKEIRNFLHGDLSCLGDPLAMHGMQEACDRILLAQRRQEKIMVHGDYDVDGVTGAAVVIQTLRLLGIEAQGFLPSREEDGYGVSLRAIQAACDQKCSILITVDCGIAAKDKISAAKAAGLEVIVIDHHKIPEAGLPPADIILNPLQTACGYPFKDLSAAGLAFKLSQALVGEKAYAFLDLAAISTVCDMAPLRGENRIIVKSGLKLLSRRTHPGLRALAHVSKISSSTMNVGHIGFTLGPRINAAGRMSSPDAALRLLLTENENEARSLALALDGENKARQKEERLTTKDAIREAERIVNFNRDRVIVVAKEGWHQGVIGIVAARLVERFHRPAVVIALQDGKGKGSGRSIKGFNLYEALFDSGEFFIEFGGHAQAAGLSIEAAKVEPFRRRINEFAAGNTESGMYVRKIEPELELALGDLSISFLREIELLEPYGLGNPRPVFATRKVQIKTPPVKATSQTVQFYVSDGVNTCEVRWTERGMADNEPSWVEALAAGSLIDLAYCAKIKNWDGLESITLEAKEIRPL